MTDTTPQQPVEPDNPAAYALARHIADHPLSTVQAAFRYLNAPLTIELHEEPDASVPASAPTDQPDRRERYAAAIRETDGWVLDGGQHTLDAVMAVADAEQAELRERHKAELRRADEINNQLMEEVQRYAEGKERPVLWSVYNAMHLRADNAEAEAERLRRVAGEAQQPETQAAAEPIVQAAKYTVNCLPEDGFDSHVFALTVEYRGNGRWGVYRNAHCCLGTDGTWSYGYAWRDGAQEPSGDEEWTEYHAGRDAWLDAHRFDEETALRLAKEQAPLVTVNGYTVTDALRMAEQRAAKESSS